MNSNILSFDFDSTGDKIEGFGEFDGFAMQLPEYNGQISLLVEDSSADDSSYLSVRQRNLSFLSNATSVSSRHSSVKTIDTSLLEEDDYQPQNLFCDGAWLEPCEPKRTCETQTTVERPSKKSRLDTTTTSTPLPPASVQSEPEYIQQQQDHVDDAAFYNLTIVDQKSFQDVQPVSPVSQTDYQSLVANARLLIDQVSSSIQEISDNADQRQQSWVERGYSPCSRSPCSSSRSLSPNSQQELLASPVHSDFAENYHPASPSGSSSSIDEIAPTTPTVQQISPSMSQQTPFPELTVLQQPQPQQQQQLNVQPSGYLTSLELVITTPVEPVWYAERPFPTFSVQITDKVTKTRVDYLSGWRATVTMVDGFGKDATEKLSGSGQHPGHSFPFVNGVAHIAGLRFRGVSSKCGGHFRLIVSVSQADSNHLIMAPVLSSPVQVLSYRLFHAPKVSFDQLLPDDSLSKMKGIGSLYAKRFQSLGIERIAQLAAIDINTIGESGLKGLIGNLRKDRGAMTVAKLAEYVQQARDICARAPHLQNANQTHTVARLTQKLHLARMNASSAPIQLAVVPEKRLSIRSALDELNNQQQQQQVFQQQQQFSNVIDMTFVSQQQQQQQLQLQSQQVFSQQPIYASENAELSCLFDNLNSNLPGVGPASFAAYLTSMQQPVRGYDCNNASQQPIPFLTFE